MKREGWFLKRISISVKILLVFPLLWFAHNLFASSDPSVSINEFQKLSPKNQEQYINQLDAKNRMNFVAKLLPNSAFHIGEPGGDALFLENGDFVVSFFGQEGAEGSKSPDFGTGHWSLKDLIMHFDGECLAALGQSAHERYSNVRAKVWSNDPDPQQLEIIFSNGKDSKDELELTYIVEYDSSDRNRALSYYKSANSKR